MSQFPIGSEISDVLIAQALGDYQRKQVWCIDHRFKTRHRLSFFFFPLLSKLGGPLRLSADEKRMSSFQFFI